MNEQIPTLADGESVNTELRASELTVGAFAAHVPASAGVLEKVTDVEGKVETWFVPADGSKKLLFEVGKNGALRTMCPLARKLGDMGLLPKTSTHPQPEDYQSSGWWLGYANRHGIDPATLRAVSKAALEAAELRAKQALEDAVKAAGGMEKLRQLMGVA